MKQEIPVLKSFVIILIMLFIKSVSSLAQSTGFIEKTVMVTTGESKPLVAKKILQEAASAQVSEDLIREMIGDDKFNKSKKVIQSKILHQSSRFIPFVKPGELIPEGSGFKMNVALKVSVKDLKILLQDSGLLVESDGSAIILPLINVVDRVNLQSYRWWQTSAKQESLLLLSLGQNIENSLRASFFKNNFYLIKPIESRLVLQIPFEHQNERLTPSDYLFFEKSFSSPFAVSGQVLILPGAQNNTYKIEVKLSVEQLASSRVVANVFRKLETEAGPFDQMVQKKIREALDGLGTDLANQVKDVWQRGAVGASKVSLILDGHLSILQQEELKEQIRVGVPQVKGIHEHLIEADRFVMDLDSNLPTSELYKKLEVIKLGGRSMQKVALDPQAMTFKLAK